MPFAPFPPWRAISIEEPGDGFRIRVRPARPMLAVSMYAVLTAMWIAGAASAWLDIAAHPARRVWTQAWLVFWVLWGGYAFVRLITRFAGSEVIVLTGGEMVIRRDVLFGAGWRRAFRAERVANLRGEPISGFAAAGDPRLVVRAHQLAFDYDGRARSFAHGVGVDDMATLLQVLRARLEAAASAG